MDVTLLTVHSCVNIFLPSSENHPQNVPVPTSKIHSDTIFQQAIPKTWQECFYTTLYTNIATLGVSVPLRAEKMAGSVIQVFLLTVIVAVVVTAENEDSSSIRVTIAQGVLQGTKKTSAKGQEYLSFTGIRYGKPPTGDLRFKQPEPADKWEGTLDASEEVKCFQVRFHSKVVFRVDT